jgi:hypothetical protein
MTPGLVATCVAIGINAVYAVRHSGNVFHVLLGGAVLLVFVSGMDSIPGSNMGSAVGVAFLLGTLINKRGIDILTMLTDLVG